MSNGILSVTNYLIPPVGGPRAYVQAGTLSATPVFLDFRETSGGQIDGQPFRPNGVFIDNTQGTGDLIVELIEISYRIRCLAGQSLNSQFPAPINCTFNITGDGVATVVFVDFPVFPDRSF